MHSVENITPDSPLNIHIPLDSLFEVNNDLAIYPVALEFITFYLNTSAEKKEYNIPIDGIYLTYNSSSTDIDNVPSMERTQSDKACKFVQNGQVYIMRQGSIYNILGTKIQ